MAGRGPLPKEPDKRERRNADPGMTELGDPGVAPVLPGASEMLEATRDWYAVWTSSPQASQFLGTDWMRLHMTAKLVDLFHRTENASVAKQLLGEIRLNEQKLGGTPEDRLRLRWRMREADQADERDAKSGARRSARDRRDPRLKLVEGGGA